MHNWWSLLVDFPKTHFESWWKMMSSLPLISRDIVSRVATSTINVQRYNMAPFIQIVPWRRLKSWFVSVGVSVREIHEWFFFHFNFPNLRKPERFWKIFDGAFWGSLGRSFQIHSVGIPWKDQLLSGEFLLDQMWKCFFCFWEVFPTRKDFRILIYMSIYIYIYTFIYYCYLHVYTSYLHLCAHTGTLPRHWGFYFHKQPCMVYSLYSGIIKWSMNP